MSPIAENIFTEEKEPRLLGGRHKDSGKLVFPLPEGDSYEPYPLSRQGTLWSYTIQRFRPKTPPYTGPEEFTPFALGYVELPDEVIVEARLTGVADDDIEIGMPLELTTVPLDPKAPDRDHIPAFQPVEQQA